MGAAIAFGGVLLTQRATDRRSSAERLWAKRAEVLTDALIFLYEIRTEGAPPSDRGAPDARSFWDRKTRLTALLALFGDRELLELFETAATPGEQYSRDYPESVWNYRTLIPFEEAAHMRITGQRLAPSSALPATYSNRPSRVSKLRRRRRDSDDPHARW